MKQLLLHILQLFISACPAAETVEEMCKVDTVVQCLRGTSNPQTHEAALALLAVVAARAPKRVLSAVLPVFTFVGLHLHQDDAFTFALITRTVSSLIPAILSAPGEQQELSLSVLSVFAEAWASIPSHRRVPLFSALLTSLSPSKYLSVLIAMLFDTLIVSNARPAEDDNPDKGSLFEALVEFCLELSREYDVQVQAESLLGLLRLVARTPAEPISTKQKQSVGTMMKIWHRD